MYKCPECSNQMIWCNDWDDDLEEGVVYQMSYCNDCEIEVTKIIRCNA